MGELTTNVFAGVLLLIISSLSFIAYNHSKIYKQIQAAVQVLIGIAVIYFVGHDVGVDSTYTAIDRVLLKQEHPVFAGISDAVDSVRYGMFPTFSLIVANLYCSFLGMLPPDRTHQQGCGEVTEHAVEAPQIGGVADRSLNRYTNGGNGDARS